jgi:hypothetical protein
MISFGLDALVYLGKAILGSLDCLET